MEREYLIAIANSLPPRHISTLPTAPIYLVNISRNRFAAMGWLATSARFGGFHSEQTLRTLTGQKCLAELLFFLLNIMIAQILFSMNDLGIQKL